MKKNIFILLVLSFFLVGCTAEYNLEIKEDSFKESVNIYCPKSEYSREEINISTFQKMPITQNPDQTKFYNKKIKEDSQNYIVNENYKHSINTISNSYLITGCYGSNTIKENEDKIVIETGKEFMCIYMNDGVKLDSAVINITTKLKVLKNNADKVSGNTYTWYIDEENYLNKPIYLEIQKSKKLAPFLQYILTIIIVLLIIVFGFYYIKRKNKKSNRF